MPILGGSGAEILEGEDPNRAGAATFAALTFDSLNKVAQGHSLPLADFLKRIPDFRFQPHRGSTAGGYDIPVHKTTLHAHHPSKLDLLTLH